MFIPAKVFRDWCGRIECRHGLPLLIRKLIRYSVEDIKTLDIPVGNQISRTGFDGEVISNIETEYVPKGKSVWEMSCSEGHYNKAIEDFEKRNIEIFEDIDKKSTVYIHVSSKPWSRNELNNWKKETKDSEWKEVRIYDAQKLEEWLEISPAVEKWFAGQLGIPIEGVETLESWWDNWCVTDEFNITPKLVLTDKEKEIKILQENLKNNNDVKIRANNIEESIAFLYSVIDSLKEDKDYFLEKCLIIDNEESFDYYFNQKDLILIPTFDFKYENSSENIIFNPLLFSDLSKVDIELKDPSKRSFAENLEELNISTNLARRYARDSGRNLTILKRMLSSNIKTPSWVKEYLIELIDLFFIQSWDENSEGDLEIIEKLTGMSYDDFFHKCKKLLLEPDSPLVKIRSKWFLKSPKDLLYLISMSIDERDLNKFHSLILNIFQIPRDFKLGDKDFRANKNLFKYSRNIKMGILKSLVLLSVYGDGLKINHINLSSYVESVVGNLIYNDCFWIYFNNVYLGLFAEASPIIFVEQLKKVLNEKPEIFINSQSVSLIWTIQKIAGDPFLFKDIVKILIELYNMDYNKNSHDSPFYSLKEMFIPWKFNSNVSWNILLEELEKIIKTNYRLGWNLLKEVSFKPKQVSFQTQIFKWRYSSSNMNITINDLQKFYISIENMMLDNIDNNCKKWVFLFRYYFYTFNNQFRLKILNKFNFIKEDLDDKYFLWNELRSIIGHHRDFSDQENYEELIIPLEKIYFELEPDNFINKHEWAFDSSDPRPLTGSFEEWDDTLREYRKNVIDEIIENDGFEGLLKFCSKIKSPEIIANFIYTQDFDEEIFNLFLKNRELSLAKSYVSIKSRNNGTWIKKFINKFDLKNSEIINDILLLLQNNRYTWDLLEELDDKIQDYYWNNFSRPYVLNKQEDNEYYVNKLIQYSKFEKIFRFFYKKENLFSVNFVGDTIIEILSNYQNKLEVSKYIVSSLLKYLKDNNYSKSNLIIIEFNFANVFRYDKLPFQFCIHEEFSKNPKLYVTYLKLEKNNNFPLGQHYWDILSKWNLIPGVDENNNIDNEFLFNWIDECNSLLTDVEMKQVYFKIGLLLGRFENNEDNLPCKGICELIEYFDNDDLNKGFSKGIDNLNFPMWTLLSDEGNFEKKLYEKYENFAEEIVEKYPITAKALKILSKEYLEKSYYKDTEKEIENFEYD